MASPASTAPSSAVRLAKVVHERLNRREHAQRGEVRLAETEWTQHPFLPRSRLNYPDFADFALVDDTSEVLIRLCANNDPQRDRIFTKGPADVLDHVTREFAIGSKLGIDATKKLSGEGFKRPWPPLIKMDAAAAVKAKVEERFGW